LQLTPVQIAGALFKAGDFVGVVGAGAAGYGDVLEREPAAVALDVRAGLVTPWTAKQVYCVVLREDGVVDPEATQACRAAERRKRLAEAIPHAEFVESFAGRKPPDDAMKLYGQWPVPVSTTQPVETGKRPAPASRKQPAETV
jgi:hypothetical protein